MKTINWLCITALALALSIGTTSCAKGKTDLSPVAKAGKKIFDQSCTVCHLAGQMTNKIGPGLKGILKNKELPSSHKRATLANVREQIEEGNPNGKPTPMPAFGNRLSETDLQNLVAYLETL